MFKSRKILFIIFTISILFIFSSCTDDTDEQIWNSIYGKELRKLVEIGFFEGQKAALEGKFYISKNEKDIYFWIDNFWKEDKNYEEMKAKGVDFTLQYIPSLINEEEKE